MTNTVEKIDIASIIANAVKTNRTSGGGRSKSTSASQVDVLGFDGVQWLLEKSKGSRVNPVDFVSIGSEFFRKENMDWTLAKKAESAKSFTKVTVIDLDVVLVSGTVVRLSEILDDVESLQSIRSFGEVYIKNEQFKCEWPLGDAVNSREGDPKATDLAPVLTPWSLFIEAMETFAQ
jgi:hypothetical protein